MKQNTWWYKCLSYLQAIAWSTRHELLGRKPPAIFLHSLFRSGSTYFFNTFREADGFWCYYEPLHHQLIELKQDRIDIFPYDRKTTSGMSHPHLNKPHFYEFKAVLQNNHIPFFNTLMSYREFSAVRQHANTYKYIMTLMVRTPENLTPLLQFNRSSLRIGWFRRFFKHSMHVYISRNPRDQFESYFRQGSKYNIFLAINLYIIASNSHFKHFDEVYSSYKDAFRVTHDLYHDLKKLAFYAAEIDKEVHYRAFMHLWVTSLIEATKHADCIIDVDRLSDSDAYRKSVEDEFRQRFSLKIPHFDDCSIKHYDRYSLENSSLEAVEKDVFKRYGKVLARLNIDKSGIGTGPEQS